MYFRTFFAGIFLTAGAFAQMTSFPKPNYFRETFSKTVTKVELLDPVKLKDFVAGDKLELSLKNYLDLVMANNTDIQIQKLSLEIPKDAIQSAMGVWDPTASASFNSTRANTPPTSVLDAGAGATVNKTLSQPAQFSVTQLLPTGLSYTASFNASKTTSNSTFNNYNPALSSSMSLSFSQPLLRNRGTYVNRLSLMTAKSRLRISEYGLKNTLLSMASGAENAYWDVVQARENLVVAESARQTAEEFLKYMQLQLDLGALSPLDIYNPKQSLAAAELSVSQAKFNLAMREDALRKQIGADLDPQIRKLPVVLTETVEVPEATTAIDREMSVQRAMANRPDLRSAEQTLDVDDLGIRSAKNGLLPNLALTGNYQANGRGGVYLQRTNVFNEGTTSSILTSVPGGLSDSLDQMFGFGYSTYQFGLRLNFPIKSRAASAAMADALVRKKTDTLALRSAQQVIRLDVLNAVTNVEGSREQLKLAKTQADYAQKNLDAENEKFKLGAEINQNVIRAQNDLTSAQSAVVTNQIGLRRNLLNLLVKTGELLDERGIVIR